MLFLNNNDNKTEKPKHGILKLSPKIGDNQNNKLN